MDEYSHKTKGLAETLPSMSKAAIYCRAHDNKGKAEVREKKRYEFEQLKLLLEKPREQTVINTTHTHTQHCLPQDHPQGASG